MDFEKYKNHLLNYLHIKGIEIHQNGLIRCINPSHADHNPSCQVTKNFFNCYSCGAHGDIYDAVQFLEGIQGQKEQYRFVEQLFSGQVAPEPYKKADAQKATEPEPPAHLVAAAKKYLSSNPNIRELTKKFLSARAQRKTAGKIQNYPDDVTENLAKMLMYWPGLDIARQEISNDVLRAAGIPYSPNPETGIYSWKHAGIVLPLGKGYKLHYYIQKKVEHGIEWHCEKRGTLKCHTFPTPNTINCSLPIILVEGELDGFVAQAAGFQNVFSAGGTNALTKVLIAEYLLTAKEIIILFDNDEAGKKAAGLTAQNSRSLSMPEKLRAAGFLGTIKIAELTEYKDTDEAILHGRKDLVASAIANAREWAETAKPAPTTAPEKPQKKVQEQESTDERTPIASPKGAMTAKELQKLLSLIRCSKLNDKEKKKFIGACANAVPEYDEETKQMLIEWGAPQELVQKPGTYKALELVSFARKFNLSYYYICKIKKAVVTKEDVADLTVAFDNSLTESVSEEIFQSKIFSGFVKKRDENAAAQVCAMVLKNNIAYADDVKYFYSFNGLVWSREPNINGIIYTILGTLIKMWIKSNPDANTDDCMRVLKLIGQRKFCCNVAKNISEMPGVWYEQIQFDGIKTKETLTLLDGVMDFSGEKDKTIHYRNSRPEEFRMRMLPYKIDDVRSAVAPINFTKFMKSNFKNADTLDMLNYYISLIPSRCAKYKVAGVMVGKSNTGKTTTLNILQDIYQYYQNPRSGTTGEKMSMIVPLKKESIMQQRYGRSSVGPDPFMAQLIGAGAAVCDESSKDDKIDAAVFKSLTGGGQLTVRSMWKQPQNFEPTAQIIISTNFAPKFDGKDQALVNRMVIIPFSIVHEPNAKGTKTEDYFSKMLKPEYPAIVKMYAEKYLDLKFRLKGKIPISKEAGLYKSDYVENQATDLNRFVDENIEFVKDDTVFTKLHDIYLSYLAFCNIAIDSNGKPLDKGAWTQNRFTRYFKGDYIEVRIKQRKFPGNPIPEQVVLNCRLKMEAPKPTQTNTQALNTWEDSPQDYPPDPNEVPF